MRPSQFLATAFSLSSLATASLWQDSLDTFKGLQGAENLLYRRQDDASTAATVTAGSSAPRTTTGSAESTGTSAESSGASTAASSGDSSATSGSDSKTTQAPSGSGKASGTAKSNATTTEFDQRDPAGGIQMITPAVISGSQFYKVGEYVTFAWNYTSLSVTPTAIDVMAYCSANQATYTIAVNQSVEETGAVTWDTGNYAKTATVALLTETYTLIIYDADSSVSATAKAGYLAPYKQFTFGMYTPQPYTPWSDFKCATCLGSGALSDHERQALNVVLGMSAITILSFTWFANGFGLF